MSYANTGENDTFINIFEKKLSGSHECDEKARSKAAAREPELPARTMSAGILPPQAPPHAQTLTL